MSFTRIDLLGMIEYEGEQVKYCYLSGGEFLGDLAHFCVELIVCGWIQVADLSLCKSEDKTTKMLLLKNLFIGTSIFQLLF